MLKIKGLSIQLRQLPVRSYKFLSAIFSSYLYGRFNLGISNYETSRLHK